MTGGLGGKALLPQPCLTVPIPWQSPASAFLCWAADPTVAWLDSRGPAIARGRYSYLAVEPFEVVENCSFQALAGRMARFRLPSGVAPFTGGAVGFLGYEQGECAGAVPNACFGFYDVVLAFDRLERRAWLVSSGLPEQQPARRAARARSRAAAVLGRLRQGAAAPDAPPPLAWRPETTRTQHMARVARTIEYIAAGDICQANITARFLAARPPGTSAARIHLSLRAQNPAPYGAYLGCGPGLAVASVSPERFLGLSAAGRIEARPIKGTRPRSADAGQDAALVADLLASEKDRAENLMIVDLLRHDIGRVAQVGSVVVPELAVLESFANVHHLVSSVQGQLRPGLSAADLLAAAFPGGSVTGAPKIRAMQIIRELEPSPRGVYCGAIAWLGWDGAMDSSVVIRTLTITPDQVVAQAGGGIVSDSDPAAEHEELMVKIRPVLRALGKLPE